MKKLLTILALMLTLCSCLSGCYLNRPMYDQKDADQVAAKGREMMQTWLDENMSDARLEECTAYLVRTRYDGNHYLTDYASGRIRLDGETKVFTIHTVSGEVYFEMDAVTKQTLNETAEAYFFEAMETIGIIPESEDEGYAFQSHVIAPVKDGPSSAIVPWVHAFDFGLPAGVEDLETFVRTPESRPPIYVSPPPMTVSDFTDLSCYDLAAMQTLENAYGLHIDLEIKNSDQIFTKSQYENQIRVRLLESGDWLDADGIRLYGWMRNRTEALERETNETTVSDWKANPETDLLFEQTDVGYRLSLLNSPPGISLTLTAYEGAEILNYDFYQLDEHNDSPKKHPSNQGRETIWVKQQDGSYLLANSSNQSALPLCHGDILVRKK